MRSFFLTVFISLFSTVASAQLVMPAPPDVKAPPADAIKTPSGLAWKMIKEGGGKVHPTVNDITLVNYTGWKADGTMIENSIGKGVAYVPVNSHFPGWTEAVQLMLPGDTRRFWIPESLTYKGAREPKGMLVYDIELLDSMPNSKPKP